MHVCLSRTSILLSGITIPLSSVNAFLKFQTIHQGHEHGGARTFRGRSQQEAIYLGPPPSYARRRHGEGLPHHICLLRMLQKTRQMNCRYHLWVSSSFRIPFPGLGSAREH
ncbi:uncharacterized protein EI90DRAFT_1299645 [Cantharellus anzutake]|uniref:uncharacterized protein n=1 Tax=Cantharellus anzutake TaxID=1750568 RepID=UPI001908CE16|nr:uncharacterized protein EI90DRAFT_1299645 [Cantharellus anzutake]KAF8342055.1 hypothetical protein EI90DRAFT_1299645 [Cantharellus anzutake]